MKRLISILFLLFLFFNISLCQQKKSILVVYGVPKKIPNINWNDGFVAAMTLLEQKYIVKWCTPIDLKNRKIDYHDYDMIFVKSSWNTPTEKFVRNFISRNKPKALLISNTNIPTSKEQFLYYDVLFYETNWYGRSIKNHPCAIQAFGINANIMKLPSLPVEKKYDYIMVGDFKYAHTKRHLKMLNKTGERLVVGSIDGGGNNVIKNTLKQNGIKVIEGVSPQKLANLYHQSRICYLPCKIRGGGDRSVLEARSCGVNVEIEPDNPKLKELLDGPILDHIFYAQQLDKGIKIMLNNVY